MKTLRIVAPWAMGLAILAWLALGVDVAQTRAALAGCDLAAYLGWSLVFIVLWLALDTLAIAQLVPDEGRDVSLPTLARVRAATYPLMAVNFHLASVALVAGLVRELRVSASRMTGGLVVYYLLDLAALCLLALAGSAVLHIDIAGFRTGLLLLAALAVALLVAVQLASRLGRRFAALRAANEMPVRRLVSILLLRVVLHASFAVFVVLAAQAFGIQIPMGDAAARMPLVLVIGALPISAGGVGTSQAALAYFFQSYASEPELLAFGLAYSFTLLVLRVPVGLVALGVAHFSPHRLEEHRV